MFGPKFRSPELVEKRRKRLKRLFVLGCSGLFAVFLIVALVPRLEAFSINDVVVEGNSIESTDALAEFVEKEISGSYFYIIPRSSWLFYPKRSVEKKLKESFKRLEEAEVSYEGGNELTLRVKERKPDWIWCSEEKCFFMEESGLIFAKAPNFSGPVFFKATGALSESKKENPIGEWFVPPWIIGDMKMFLGSLEELGYRPIGLNVTSEQDTEIVLSDNSIIKLSPKKDIAISLLDIKDALKAGLLPKDKELEYIDLRFENKVFFKERE